MQIYYHNSSYEIHSGVTQYKATYEYLLTSTMFMNDIDI